jgi:hypothetical protein
MDYRSDDCSKIDLTHLFDDDVHPSMKLFFVMCNNCISDIVRKDKETVKVELNALLNSDAHDLSIVNSDGIIYIHA